MRRILIVNNPAARQGRSQDAFDGWKLLLSDSDVGLVGVDEAPLALREAAARAEVAAPDEKTAIIVFGGDGTLNRLLPYLVSSHLPLAIFPAGTVNDFALQTGFTANWEDLARLIRQDRRRSVDLVAVNGRPFAAYASIGFGASVSAMATRTRNLMTPLRQLAPTLVAPLNAALTVFFTRRLGRALLVEDAEGTREALTTGIYVSNLPKLNRVR